MEHLRIFDNIDDYNLVKSSLVAPNVSLIEDENYCKYKPIYTRHTNIGDVVLFNKDKNEIEFLSAGTYEESYWMDLSLEPIGVVAVGSDYTPDQSTRIISLVNMSIRDPENGTLSEQPLANNNYMCWGGKDISLGLPGESINIVNPLTGEYKRTDKWGAVLPSNLKYNSTGYIDPLSGYRYCYNKSVDDPNNPGEGEWYQDLYGPYPILKNKEKNNLFYSNGMMTVDFNGQENTNTIVGASPDTNWKTVPNISNNSNPGNYPPAFCCRRYKTPGTEAGDWYLPAIGELSFISTFYGTINKGLEAVAKTKGLAVRLGRDENYGSWYWSSSEYSNGLARNIATLDGTIDNDDKSYTNISNRVRAYLKLD